MDTCSFSLSIHSERMGAKGIVKYRAETGTTALVEYSDA
jgi:hypothetical protein